MQQCVLLMAVAILCLCAAVNGQVEQLQKQTLLDLINSFRASEVQTAGRILVSLKE